MVHYCCGLFWHRPRAVYHYVWYNLVPLINSNVEVTVIDQMSQVDITQTYVNYESYPIEASYIFPLDERAAVCGFEAEIAGNRIVGEAKEKQQAKREYDAAILRGDGAYLLEEEKADIFKMKVGNIPPGERVTIKITYVAELKCEVGELKKRFLLPTFVAPRYTPPPTWHQSESDRSLEAPLTGAGKGYDLSINMTVIMMSNILSIDSPTHAISKSIEGSSASVGFAFGSVPMDKDVVVNIEVAQPHEPRVCLEENNGSLAAMVTLFPHIQFQDVPVEIIFVIDRSGSMRGDRMRDARDAMQLFIRALPEDCYFNIFGFGSRYVSLFSHSTKYDEASLRSATSHIQKMEANLGGTELVNPLQCVFKQPPIRGYSRQVFVLTDGEVSNTDEVINLVRSNSKTSRVFSLGIGDSVSHHLVEGIARAGKGTAQFVKGGADMSVKVMKQLKEAIQPALQNVKVNWGENVKGDGPSAPAPAAPSGAIVRSLLGYTSPQASAPPAPRVEVHQAPFEVPPIFDSQHFLIYAMYGENSPPSTVKITAESPDGPLTVELPVDHSKKIVGKLIHTLAARAMIRDLEEGRSWMTKMGFNAQSPQVKAEIVRLGTKYQLASLYTSFIAVERRSGIHYDCWVGPQFEPVAVAVPLFGKKKSKKNAFHGGGGGRGGGGGGGGNYVAFACSAAAPPPSAPGGLPPVRRSAAPLSHVEMEEKCKSSSKSKQKDRSEKLCEMDDTLDEINESLQQLKEMSYAMSCTLSSEALVIDSFSSPPPSSSSSSSSSFAPSPVKSSIGSAGDILMEQSVNGSFSLTPHLASLLGTSVDLLKDVLANLKLSGGETEKIIATAAVLVYLEKKCGGQRDLWDLSASKAKRFIEKQGTSKSLSEILQALEVLF